MRVDINPKGLVPAIEYKGKALYESLVICEFLEDAFPSFPALLPSDPFERAYARLWIDFVSKSIVSTFFRLIMAQQADKQEAALRELGDACRTFAEKVKGPYFLGEKFSLVDVAVVPIIVRDYFIEEYRGYSRGAVSERWKTYAETVEIRDSVLRVASVSDSLKKFCMTILCLYYHCGIQDKERYEEVYGRDLRDEAQSQPAKAIRSGRDMP